MKREKAVQEVALRKAAEKEKAAEKAAAKVDKTAKGRQKGGKMAQNVRPATKEDPVTHTNGSVVISRAEASDLSIGLSYANDVRYTNSAFPVTVWDTPHSKREFCHGRHFIVNVVEVDDNDTFIRSISTEVARVLTEKVALNPRLGIEEENQNQHALKKGATVNSERSRSQNVKPSPRSLNPRSGMTDQPTRSKVSKSKCTGSWNVQPSHPLASLKPTIDDKVDCGQPQAQNIESSPPSSFDMMDWERFSMQDIHTSRPLEDPVPRKKSTLTIHHTGVGDPARHSTKRTRSISEADGYPPPRGMRPSPGITADRDQA